MKTVRAAATAEILVRAFESHPRLVTASELAPGGSPSAVAQALSAYGKAHGVAVVGHEPGIGELAAWLIGARTPLPFKKGGICRIDFGDWPPARQQGTLIWLAMPKMLRGLD